LEDIVSFVERISKLILTDEQKEVLTSLADVSVKDLAQCIGRGFGKTLLSTGAALWFATVYSDSIGKPLDIVFIDSQERMWKHLNDFFTFNSDLLEKLKNKGKWKTIPAEQINLTNGSNIYTCLATPKGVRSKRADIVFVDEAYLVPDNVIKDSVIPVLTGDICKIILISTPSINNGYFFDVITDPKKYHFIVKQYSSEKCPWTLEMVKKAKVTLSREAYAREILARVPQVSERNPFKNYTKCVKDIPIDPERVFGSWLEAGLDLAYGDINTTALVSNEKIKSKRKVIECITYKAFDPQVIVNKINTIKPRIVRVDDKPVELANLVRKEIQPYCKGISFSYINCTFFKKQMVSQMARLINTKLLSIPENLVSLRLEFNRYHEGKRTGDNLIDALMLSCLDDSSTHIDTPRQVVFGKPKVIGLYERYQW
jgi:hypothetical protein